MIVFYVVLVILFFSILIFVHEFGHFFTAKLFGVQVNEFSLFMGPAIWKKQVGETLYALRCIPIGGYCAMEGEDGESDNPRAFTNAKVWKRLIILLAGSTMNLLLGLILTVVFVSVYFDAIPNTQITAFEPTCPYQSEEGLQVGDRLYSIDGERIYVIDDFHIVTDYLSKDNVYDIVVIRDGEKVELNGFRMEKQNYDGQYRYGFSMDYRKKTVASVLDYSWNQYIDFANQIRLSVKMIAAGSAGVKDISGPVGIVSTVTKVATQSPTIGQGILMVMYFFALIAVNIAIVNLLPIPALDGGRAVCLLITAAAEKILGRKIDPKYEGYLHAGFMILLMLFIAFITVKDIWQSIGG